ncbi:helix-turn-helix domain-containing protein [Lachnospiraceae bacterium WCA-9-b2]|jgi:transcriptional regulator with XRE-family HTH domain|uniref:Helix-turn-helix domain-containing protein n=1 Tax=Sporofaciens musculi TaxID=2681861 RepID=A0A7X3ML03_9FIRM|nr:helix-turn-helix transcriptional regulator [Sporofaciens musculi]MXP78300.1 helix-turn-helix domain-containing protein [Sporofaciens musculi]
MFGDMIKNLRQSRSLNQVQLADSLNVSKQTVSNWENNNILPSIEMLVKISQFFSVSTDYLLELDSRSYIEVTGLTDVQLAHVRQIIDDIKGI